MTETKTAASDDETRERIHTRFTRYPILTEYFPLALVNGSVVRGVVASCSRCSHPITPGTVRGEVREVVGDCYRVTAIGWCVECDLLTPFLFHVMPCGDGFKFVTLDHQGWPEEHEDRKIIEFKKRAVA